MIIIEIQTRSLLRRLYALIENLGPYGDAILRVDSAIEKRFAASQRLGSLMYGGQPADGRLAAQIFYRTSPWRLGRSPDPSTSARTRS